MKYEIQYHPISKMWNVWRVQSNGNAEIVKRFKNESSARNWVKRQ